MIDNDKISNTQLWIFFVLTIIGIGIFSLPRIVAETAGTDGWVSVILGGLTAILALYIMSKLAIKFPKYTIVEMANKVLGRFVAIPMLLIFWLFLLFSIAGMLRVFGEVIKMSILIRTPIEIILISILILVLILIRSGIEAIVRFDEAVFIFMAGMTVIGIFLALPQMDWTNMLPFMRTPPKEFFIGTFQTTYSYAGFELVLLLIPFLKKPDKIFKSGVLAISIVSITYLVATFLSFGYFGVAEVKELIWPTMSVIRSIEVPGSFVERLEGVVMTQWVVFAFTSLIAYTYSLALLPSRVFNTKEFKHFCPLFIPIVYMLAMVPENVVEVYEYLEKSTLYLGTVSIFILPLTILIVSSIRKMGGQNNG